MLGQSLINVRKKRGLSQEYVAEKLSVSRQTISNWETNKALPDIYQAKKLSVLYNLTLDELLNFDVELKRIEEEIKNTNEEKENKIDWTKAWGKKYPVLITYQHKVEISKYALEIRKLLNSLQREYGYSDLDSMLVLKDILYHEWKSK